MNRKPTQADLKAARGKTVPDVIARGLKLLFVGINPGLYSAAVGHHFARPGNRFWPALAESEFTNRRLSPFEDHELPRWGLGITNIAGRATARANELSDEELVEGIELLAGKVRRYRVRNLAVLGITAYRTAFDRPHAQIGRTEQTIGVTPVWVLPNPSGLNAHYQRTDFVRLFRELRDGLS